jgi:multidrug resistance efflux pump
VKGPSHKRAFQQNSLQRVKAGDEAEAAFDAVPDRVFKGRALILDVGAVFEAVTVEDGDMPERGEN